MKNNDLIYNSSNKILVFLIFSFPLIIIFRSAAINTATITLSIIVLFGIFKKDNVNFFKIKIVTYLVCFFSIIFINTIYNYQSFELLVKSLGNFRYILLSAGVFFVLEKFSKRQISYFINFNLILVILICLDIIYQYFFYKNIFGFTPNMCSSASLICSRFSGIFGKELIAGGYLSQIGLLILFLKNNLDNKKLFNSFLFIFLFIAIILTGERNAFLILVLTVFFICMFRKKIFSVFLIIMVLLSIILVTVQYSASVNIRFLGAINNFSLFENKNLINKIKENPWSYHYQAAIELFLDKPFLGHGIKSFRIKCAETKIDKKMLEQNMYYKDYRACSTHPHNYLLEFLSEQGIVGGLFYMGLIFMIIFKIYKINKKKKDSLIFLFLGSLILAIIFPFKPSGSFLSTFNASLFFYILGFFLHSLKKLK